MTTATNRPLQTGGDAVREHETWAEYLHRVTQGAPQRAVAKALGVNQSGVNRWGKTGQPPAVRAIELARVVGASPVEALIAADYLAPEDVKEAYLLLRPTSALSDAELIAELTRRLAERTVLIGDDISPQFLTPPENAS